MGVTPDPGETTAGQVWERFLEGPETLGPTPGVRERWHRGRRRFVAWALRVDAAVVRARVAEAQAALGGWVRPSAPEELHVTLWVLGFPSEAPEQDDELPTEDLARMAKALEGAGPVALHVGGLNAFLSAPFLEVTCPDGSLGRLRERLGPLSRELRFAPYLPHLTVGVFRESLPTGLISARLRALREATPIPLTVSEAHLCEIDAFDGEARLGWSLCADLTS
ncbi:MAG: 2'-5' RNA ligase family protein [Alphaproteobacteria bacterium]|nr:2'-5' RNA ligase family protein [Alphaproteobacteria bacterium]